MIFISFAILVIWFSFMMTYHIMKLREEIQKLKYHYETKIQHMLIETSVKPSKIEAAPKSVRPKRKKTTPQKSGQQTAKAKKISQSMKKKWKERKAKEHNAPPLQEIEIG